MRRLILGIGVLLVVASCGGGASDDGGGAVEALGDDVLTVSSSDGKATLTLTAASLPDGVRVGDLQVDWSQGLSSEPGAPLVGVRLSPDGLSLNQSASLRFELPDTDNNQFMVAHVSEDVFEFIPGEIDLEPGQRSMLVSVEHFSSLLVFTPDGLATVTTTASPPIVAPDQTQLVESEVWIQSTAVDLWMPISYGISKQWQLITFDGFSVLQGSGDHHGTVQWRNATFGSKPWDPQFLISEKTPDDVSVFFAGSSTCLEANSIDPAVYNVINLSMTVTAKGPIVDRALFNFAYAVGETQTTGAYASGDAFKAAVGADLKGFLVVVDSAESECTDGSATTSSTASTMPPVDDDATDQVKTGQDARSHIVGVAPMATSDDTLGVVVRFAQPWDTLPPSELRSFFIWLSVVGQGCSVEAGWELHEGNVQPLGPIPMRIVDDGSVILDTGCTLDPREPLLVNTRGGSWAQGVDNAVFGEDGEFLIPADTPLESVEGRCLIYDLIVQEPIAGCTQP